MGQLSEDCQSPLVFRKEAICPTQPHPLVTQCSVQSLTEWGGGLGWASTTCYVTLRSLQDKTGSHRFPALLTRVCLPLSFLLLTPHHQVFRKGLLKLSWAVMYQLAEDDLELLTFCPLNSGIRVCATTASLI